MTFYSDVRAPLLTFDILQILSSQAQQEAEGFIWSIRPFEVKMSRILRHSPNFSNRFVTKIYLGEIVEIYNMNEKMSTNPRMLTYPPDGEFANCCL